jgi:hypothetical protein
MSSLLTILVFAALASPASYRTTRQLGSWVADASGVPTIQGLLLHGLVFVMAMAILGALFGRSSGYLMEGGMKFVTRDDQDDENTKHYQQDRFVYSVTA